MSVTIANQRDRKILIDSNGLGEVMMFSVIRITSDGAAISNRNTIDERSKEDRARPVLLKPEESYTKTLRVSLADEFFEGVESFEFVTAYRSLSTKKYNGKHGWIGTVYSEPVRIVLKECDVD